MFKKAMKAVSIGMAAALTLTTTVFANGTVTSNTNTEAATQQVDKVVMALNASSFDMTPFGPNSIPRMWMNQNIYGSLFCTPYYGATLEELEPWLAESYEKVDDLTYKVKLYENIVDNKGNQITSEDIVYSYLQIRFFQDRDERKIPDAQCSAFAWL